MSNIELQNKVSTAYKTSFDLGNKNVKNFLVHL